MANNYDDYGYEETSNTSSGLGKKLLIITLIILAIIILIYLLNGCSRENKNVVDNTFNYETELLDAGKTYFQNNTTKLPAYAGECTEVKLVDLTEKGLLDPEDFKNCNSTSTYVRVCKLENGKLHYTPWLTCTDKMSDDEYADIKEGTNADIITDSSYIDFKYLPKVLESEKENLGEVEELWKDEITYASYKTLATTKYYKYRDKEYIWDVTTNTYYTSNGDKTNANEVKEYYTSSPKNGYDRYNNKTTSAYKWYTTDYVREYYLGTTGERKYSNEPLGEYNIYDTENVVEVTMYRTRTVSGTYAPTKYYVCSENATSNYIVYQPNTECGKGSNSNFTYQRDIIYSCASSTSNSDSVIANKVASENSKCTSYSAWGKATEEKCDTSNVNLCQSRTVQLFNWYKLVESGNRIYYPSGATKASGENVYYTSAPIDGAIKDTTTKATAYKWYKSSTKTLNKYSAVAPTGYASATKTSTYRWTDWTDWSKTNPAISDGRTREIETKTKIKLQAILGNTTESWKEIGNYVTLEEMIQIFNDNGNKVTNLEDITNNDGEIKYELKLLIRNKKEANN